MTGQEEASSIEVFAEEESPVISQGSLGTPTTPPSAQTLGIIPMGGGSGGYVPPNTMPSGFGGIGTLGGIGSHTLLSPGIPNYLNNLSDYAIAEFIRIFLSPHEKQSRSDATYPTDIEYDILHNRFHLVVWAHTHLRSLNKLWEHVDSYGADGGNRKVGRLTFKTAESRNEFYEWVEKYERKWLLDGKISKVYVPAIGDYFRGTFVRHVLPGIDGLGIKNLHLVQMGTGFESCAGSAHLIHTLLPAWLWIVKNCDSTVLRMDGGWMFSDGNDAANFTICDVANMDMSNVASF